MITPADFYRQTNDNFKRVFDKMDKLHEETSDEIKELEKKVNSVDEKLNIHLSVVDALEKREQNDKKRNYFITGIIVTVSFGLWKVFEFLINR